MSLVGEILDAGLAPRDLVRQGVRKEIVEICCARLGVAYDVEGDGISWDRSGLPKAKRKRRKGVAKSRGVAASSEDDAAVLHQPDRTPAQTDTDQDMEEMLRKKVELERERAILLRMQRKTQTAELSEAELVTPTEPQTSASNSPNVHGSATGSPVAPDSTVDLQAMRLAALSSMKRKRNAEGDSAVGTSNTVALVKEPPANAPRAPKSRYRDIDAPQLDLAQREQEAADALLMTDESTEYPAPLSSQSTGSMAKLRARPVSYVDEEFNHVTTAAPTGYVDYAAPLPSLQQQQQERRQHDQHEAVKTEKRSQQNAKPSQSIRQRPAPIYLSKPRPAPFLENQATLLVIEDDTSDESANESSNDASDNDEQLQALKRIRDTNTQAMMLFWGRERGPRGQRNGSGESTPKDAELTRSLLQSKEREILALKEKMRALVEHRKARHREDAGQRQLSVEPGTTDKEEETVSRSRSCRYPTHRSWPLLLV
jgi:hypothetical protein